MGVLESLQIVDKLQEYTYVFSMRVRIHAYYYLVHRFKILMQGFRLDG